jgi:hypothetical protein
MQLGVIGGIVAGAAVPFAVGALSAHKIAARKPADLALPAVITAFALPVALLGASLVVKQPTLHKLLFELGTGAAAGEALIGTPLITFAANWHASS